jgi:hypothetical protein
LGNLSYCLNTESLGNLYNLNYVFYLIFSAQTANSDIANFFCTFFRYAQGLSSEIFLESSQWNKALKLLDESFDSAQSGLKKDLTSDDLFMFRKRVRDAIEKLELEKFRLETTPESTDINSSCFTDGMMFASCGRKFFEGTKNLSKEEFLAKLRTETLIRPRLVALTNDETIARTTLELDYFLEFTTSLQSLLDAGT